MSLGTVDDGGVWVADVIYVHDDSFNLYWLSQEDTRHSKAIAKNSKVGATITLERAFEGLQIEGKAKKVTGALMKLARKHWKKSGKKPPKSESEILDPGESWYRLTPTKIELINEPLFGFEKKVVTI